MLPGFGVEGGDVVRTLGIVVIGAAGDCSCAQAEPEIGVTTFLREL